MSDKTMGREEAVRQAIARGWCTPENLHKEMDIELAEAIAREVITALTAQPAGEVVAWLCDARDGENVDATSSVSARDTYARAGRTIVPLYTRPAPQSETGESVSLLLTLVVAAKKLLVEYESQTGTSCECDHGDSDTPAKRCAQCCVRDVLYEFELPAIDRLRKDMREVHEYLSLSRARIVSALQSAHDRMTQELPKKYGEGWDGDFDTMLDAISYIRRCTCLLWPRPAPEPEAPSELFEQAIDHINSSPAYTTEGFFAVKPQPEGDMVKLCHDGQPCEKFYGKQPGEKVRGLVDAQLLEFIASEYLSVQPFDMPTGQGDADIGWQVVEPGGRILAEVFHDDLRAALQAALSAKGENEDTTHER